MLKKVKWFVNKVIAHERANPLLTYPIFLLRVAICRARYRKTLARCRRKVAAGEKLKVVFLVSNCSKWKAQSLYELMAKSAEFDPVLAVTSCDDELGCTDAELKRRMDADIAFYERLGNKWVMAYDLKMRKVLPLDGLNPDIVFFPVPWGLIGPQNVFPVSRFALTCYIPYALECFDQDCRSRRFDFNHLAHFQQLMWLFLLVSERYAAYTREPHFNFERAGEVAGLGHTALDPYCENVAPQKNYTIFAPHFSFSWNGIVPIMNHATFQ